MHVDTRLFWALNKNTHVHIPMLGAHPVGEVVRPYEHGPGAMRATLVAKGFNLSVIMPSLTFLGSPPTPSSNSMSRACHWLASAGCLRIWPFSRSSFSGTLSAWH